VTVTSPDGGVTSYAYAGNATTVTDPAGKWKRSITDAMGNLIQVQEPSPAGGSNLVTNYSYNGINQLMQVSMPRSNGTQTRTFVYSGSDMTSATNPENGTVTYEYDAAHHVTKRTDAKAQETRYSYDTYGRLTATDHYVPSPPRELRIQGCREGRGTRIARPATAMHDAETYRTEDCFRKLCREVGQPLSPAN